MKRLFLSILVSAAACSQQRPQVLTPWDSSNDTWGAAPPGLSPNAPSTSGGLSGEIGGGGGRPLP